MEQKIFWVGFNKVKGIGPVRLKKLLNYFGNLERAWHASLIELRSVGLGEKTLINLQNLRNNVDLEEEYEKIIKNSIKICT